MNPERIRDLADQLLAAAEDALEDREVEVPERRYVTAGMPAVDCEQLVVYLTTGAVRALDTPGSGVGPRGSCHVTPVGTYAVELWREVCTMEGAELPTAEQLADDGARLLADAGALLAGLLERWRTGELFEGVTCSGVDWSPGLVALEPSGGVAGVRITLTVGL